MFCQSSFTQVDQKELVHLNAEPVEQIDLNALIIAGNVDFVF